MNVSYGTLYTRGVNVRLYKYLDTRAACLSVADGNIKFSPISELNDPSELFNFVNISDTEESLDRLRKEGYSDTEMDGLRRQKLLLRRIAPEMILPGLPESKEEATALLKLPIYADYNHLQTLLNFTVNNMISRTGIFCLSTRYDSFPMWAHYAYNARGCIVEFDGLDSFFKGDETGVLNIIRPIEYQTPRRTVTFEPDSHEEVFFSKLSDWSYESEYRIVKPLDECTYDSGKKMHLLQIPRSYIKRVIVGWNFPDSIESITKQIHEINPEIEVTLASVDKGVVSI